MPIAYQCRMCKGPPAPAPWIGPCPNCGGWYRANEVRVGKGECAGAEVQPIAPGKPISLSDAIAQLTEEDFARVPAGMAGLDWVLGGGFPRPSALLLSALEGAGKSTLILEAFRAIAGAGGRPFYCSAEESERQLAARYARMGKFPAKLAILSESDLPAILDAIEDAAPDIAAIDSLHALDGIFTDDGKEFPSGGVAAVTRAGREIKRFAERCGICLIAVAHSTNDGQIAGGASVRHLLDGTIWLRRAAGDSPDRILECLGKNRFAPPGRRARLELHDGGIRDCGPLTEAA